MTSAREIAVSLLRRLLDGERGQVELHLAYLLDKSSSLRDSDKFYRSVLPPEFASLELSQETREEIIAALCSEVARNPDDALISVMSMGGDDFPTMTVAMVLANPPRPLKMRELAAALALAKAYLPGSLQKDPDFIPRVEVERIIQLAKKLRNVIVEDGNTDEDKSDRHLAKSFAEELIEGLAESGFSRS